MEFSKVVKSGRSPGLRNRSGHNCGNVVYLVKGGKPNGDWMDAALCGTSPGKRSLG